MSRRQQDLGKFPPPLSATVSIERPLMTSAFARLIPISNNSKCHKIFKEPLRSTLIETLNVCLIQLKTESKCHVQS